MNATEQLALDTLSKCERPFYYDKENRRILTDDGMIIFFAHVFSIADSYTDSKERQDAIGQWLTELINKKLNERENGK